MNIYKEYQNLELDKSYIGLEEGDTEGGYFCTPIGAKVIGWEGGGIHYCFISGFDEIVFAVNPNGSIDENDEEKNVYPLAENFKIFLQLILATKSVTPIEQIVYLSKEDFEDFIVSDDNNVLPEQQAVLNYLQEKLDLITFKNPYEYVKKLQSKFDYSQIKFTDEYYNALGIDMP
ncbi:MAG: hypothetical protein ACRCXA_11540 [Peptostreptococcaceae bacterium]